MFGRFFPPHLTALVPSRLSVGWRRKGRLDFFLTFPTRRHRERSGRSVNDDRRDTYRIASRFTFIYTRCTDCAMAECSLRVVCIRPNIRRRKQRLHRCRGKIRNKVFRTNDDKGQGIEEEGGFDWCSLRILSCHKHGDCKLLVIN